ncbi:hypothetical protein SSPO_000810 [Streptomyces antimycoticus]|uniref:Uncharacterized protein n=1 Tax=Streptomyces antimycoticus TaxID=68175 RepID=A0A499UA76_9ACTN|nr:hypothetical protein SSPO_000810 [Streptomyces antimycoticus]
MPVSAARLFVKRRSELKAPADTLPVGIEGYGQGATKDFVDKFDNLDSEVHNKSKRLVLTLAQTYIQSSTRSRGDRTDVCFVPHAWARRRLHAGWAREPGRATWRRSIRKWCHTHAGLHVGALGWLTRLSGQQQAGRGPLPG